MMLNADYSALKPSYLFRDVAQRRKAYEQAHPDARVISLGIGDADTAPIRAMTSCARPYAATMQGMALSLRWRRYSYRTVPSRTWAT